jgi:NAD(P)-dependent dehydrogenase (short-subunit alcohol dehydrogenase family)
MVNFIQPKVDPLPTGIDLTGQTIVVTGASSGLGLEVTRQLVLLRASTVILAVRNVAKGESCATTIRQDPLIKAQNPEAAIKVMELDMELFASVQSFAKRLREEIPTVNTLILNAGIGLLELKHTPIGHDKTTQVNYHSNVLLIAELLPYLEAGAEKTGTPARISWVGSRAHETTSLEKNYPLKSGEGVIDHMDRKEAFVPFRRYGDSKFLCALFMYSLAPRLDSKKVILNMMCPGMVNTNMSDVLPLYLRLIVNVIKSIRARSVEVGGWIILNGALVMGPESHGKFLRDKTIAE